MSGGYVLLVSGTRDGVPVSLLSHVIGAHMFLASELGLRLLIVHGGARGVDSQAEGQCNVAGVPTKVFPADWDRFGRSAGMKRNHEMCAYLVGCRSAGDRVQAVAFPRGRSAGTRNMIAICRHDEIPVQVWE